MALTLACAGGGRLAKLGAGNTCLGAPYSKGSRSSPDPWARQRAHSSKRTRRLSNRSERALAALTRFRTTCARATSIASRGWSVSLDKPRPRHQSEPESPASNGREMIDDFRLRGARPCRHMGGHLTKEGGARGGVAVQRGDKPYRSFETTEDYRKWCNENLPRWFGYSTE